MMIRLFLSVLFSLSLFSLPAQSLEEALAAFGKGDATRIGSWIESDVEMTILGEMDFYAKNDAVATLKAFFTKYPPKSITEMHKGTSKNSDSRFIIAELLAGNGRFRVYLYSEQSGSKFVLQEIRIEKE
jgi:hypothetical protein